MQKSPWPPVFAALLVGIAVGAIGLSFLDRDSDEAGTVQTDELQTALATAEQRDLRGFDEWAGTLETGPAATITATTRGTLTQTAAEGTNIIAGDVVAQIDGTPVVALYGPVPQFRELSVDSDAGADIRQLEENLVALGFDPNGTVAVDETFSAETAVIVEAWEAELGLSEPDGIVRAGQIAFIAGPSEVTARTSVGSQVNAGQQILGTVTLAESGFVAVPQDLTSIEATLNAGAELLANTEAGRVDFDDDAGVAGTILRIADEAPSNDADDEPTTTYALAPIGAIVADVVLDDTSFVAAGRPIYRWEVPLDSIQLAVSVDETASFEVGRTLEVELPDGQLVDATVSQISDVARTLQDGGTAVTVVDVTVQANEIIESIFTAGPVTIRVETDVTEGAVLVPVRGLLALADGGHAIEVVDRGLVGVELGAFDDGWVEITNDAIAVGEELVVPT